MPSDFLNKILKVTLCPASRNFLAPLILTFKSCASILAVSLNSLITSRLFAAADAFFCSLTRFF